MTHSKCEISSNGTKRWFNDEGQLHRLNGPAVEYADGDESWWIEDEIHRLDGPAFKTLAGYEDWWINGEQLSKEQFDQHPLVIFYRLSKDVI
jgi:hypothetical protein